MAKKSARPPAANRRSVLAAIHVMAGAKQLNLDKDVYRDIVERVSGEHGPAVRSAGDCSPQQLEAVAKELRRMAGQQWEGRPKGDLCPQLQKIEALLTDAGREWNYARAIARRVCKVDQLEWCNPAQLGKVIAAMQIDADRRSKREAGA